MKKVEKAKLVLQQIKDLGMVPKLQGEWVVFDKPLPSAILLEVSTLSNEIAELVKCESANA